MNRFFPILSLVLTCSGCITAFDTAPYDQNTDNRIITYSLPKTAAKIRLTETNGVLSFEIVETITRPDPAHTYQLMYKPSMFSSDDMTFTMNNNLFQKIEFEADDQLDDFLVELYRAALISDNEPANEFVEADISQQNIILERIVDMDSASISALNEDLNILLAQYVADEAPWCRSSNDLRRCLNLERIKSTTYQFNLTPSTSLPNTFPGEVSNPGLKVDSGIYVRPHLPYMLSLSRSESEAGKKFTFQQYELMVAGEKPIYSVDLKRARFVKKTTTIDFTDGSISAMSFSSPSVGMELARLVTNAVKLPFVAVSELVSLNISTGQDQSATQDSPEAKIDTAISDLEEVGYLLPESNP